MQAVLRRQQRQGRHPHAVVAKKQWNLAYTPIQVSLCIQVPHPSRHRAQRRDGVLRRLHRGCSSTRVGQRAATHVRWQGRSSPATFITRSQEHVARPLYGGCQKRIAVEYSFCLTHHTAELGRQCGSLRRSGKGFADFSQVTQAPVVLGLCEWGGVNNGLGASR